MRAHGASAGRALDIDEVRSVAAQFQGTIEQMPPPFSAKKIAGVPAYKLARKKKEVVLQAVQVEIKEFEILAVAGIRPRFAHAWVRYLYTVGGARDGPEARVRGASGQLATDYSRRVRHRRCGTRCQRWNRNAAGNCGVALCASTKAGAAVTER